jgi:hypothetical protein
VSFIIPAFCPAASGATKGWRDCERDNECDDDDDRSSGIGCAIGISADRQEARLAERELRSASVYGAARRRADDVGELG